MITRTEVKTVKVDMKCDECNKGYLRPTGQCFMTSPPKYPHECDKCGKREVITGKTYPYIDYE